MKEFSVTIRLGIDDLLSHSPYQNSHDWPTFSPFYEITEEQYLSNPKEYEERVQSQNDQYIKELKEAGTYGDKHTTHFQVNELKEFNDNKSSDYSKWGIMMPLGKVSNKEAPKFGIKYNGDEGAK